MNLDPTRLSPVYQCVFFDSTGVYATHRELAPMLAPMEVETINIFRRMPGTLKMSAPKLEPLWLRNWCIVRIGNEA